MERPRRLSAARAAQIRLRIRRPPAHWTLLAFLAAMLLLLLLVCGLTDESVGGSRTPLASSRSQPAASQSLLTADGRRLRSRRLPRRSVALTFDDGPDPDWTPRIARELRRLRVPATFFVLGSRVVRHPGVVRDLWRQGFELGNHTFTHDDVYAMPETLLRLQLDATENAVAGAAGVRPRLFRPPYSSVPEAITRQQERTLARIARDGYVIVLSDRDGRDWDPRVSAAGIERRAIGRRGGANVVLLHDGGGKRAQTLAALPRIVRRYRAAGYRFVDVSGLLGVERSAVDVRATRWQRLRGRMLIVALTGARWIAAALTLLLGPIGILILMRAAFIVALAHRHARRRRALPGGGSYVPSVSIVVPAFNEAMVIERAVRSFRASDYP
jgi:peptidoglycan/xylan/chitin deacetylase (PgdA/CDA1 family)